MVQLREAPSDFQVSAGWVLDGVDSKTSSCAMELAKPYRETREGIQSTG